MLTTAQMACPRSGRWLHLVAGVLLLLCAVFGDGAPAGEAADGRIRTTPYFSDAVYRLRGYVGYQIDVEFETGESFLGLGAGDLAGLRFAAEGNHLFLKPRAAGANTNITVLTNRRVYQFDYSATTQRPDPGDPDVVYALRFSYPPATVNSADKPAQVDRELAGSRPFAVRNFRYAYCGSPSLKPLSAWDDGVQTHLQFAAREELPAIFASNDDGSESLVNFTIEAADVVVHRVGRRFIVRRGKLVGCIVNQAFAGRGDRLASGTVSPAVQRITRGAVP
ncbi:MAG TPA: TrbG/VirB9 family P-type conjugative transfer protein [Steroidobacteraceae bacterium]|jgi:type IV secretion system protein VirB9|nr:TrbG/VirB9 family P-type conjugative transfer protein [Steroidobacteraceae bacterium]